MSQKPVGQAMRPAAAPVAALLIADLQRLIEEARRSAAQTVNMGLTLLYWRIGKRIRTDVLGKCGLSTARRFCRHCRQN